MAAMDVPYHVPYAGTPSSSTPAGLEAQKLFSGSAGAPAGLEAQQLKPGRRKKSSQERREQRRRADGRVVCRILAAFHEMDTHRGNTVSKLGSGLRAALTSFTPGCKHTSSGVVSPDASGLSVSAAAFHPGVPWGWEYTPASTGVPKPQSATGVESARGVATHGLVSAPEVHLPGCAQSSTLTAFEAKAEVTTSATGVANMPAPGLSSAGESQHLPAAVIDAMLAEVQSFAQSNQMTSARGVANMPAPGLSSAGDSPGVSQPQPAAVLTSVTGVASEPSAIDVVNDPGIPHVPPESAGCTDHLGCDNRHFKFQVGDVLHSAARPDQVVGKVMKREFLRVGGDTAEVYSLATHRSERLMMIGVGLLTKPPGLTQSDTGVAMDPAGVPSGMIQSAPDVALLPSVARKSGIGTISERGSRECGRGALA